MRHLALIIVAIVVAAATLPTHQPAAPTPEQLSIADLREQIAKTGAKLENAQQQLQQAISQKAEPVQLPAPLPFEQAYPEQWKVIEGLNTAVNRCVETTLKTNIELEKLRSDLAKLQDTAKFCPVEVKAEKPATQVVMPTNEYNVAVAAAEAQNKKVLFVISQNGCVFCDQLEQQVIDQLEFQTAVNDKYVISKINISNDPASASHFEVKRTPAVLTYDPARKTWGTMPQVPRNIPAFLAMLKGI